MDLTKLKTKIAEVLGVSDSEKELAYDIFIKNIFQTLEPEESLKVPKIGFFQYKTKPINTGDIIITGQTTQGKNNLLYAPLSEDLPSDSKSMFLIIDVSQEKKDLHKLDEDVFSIGVGKPILPISEQYNEDDTETNYVLLKKSIEERVGEIISESEHLKNFDIWDDYVSMHIFSPSDMLETDTVADFKATSEFEYFEEEITSGSSERDFIPDEDDLQESSPEEDIAKMDIPEPEILKPDIPEPEVSKPDIPEPEVSKPDIPEPKVSEPDISEEEIPEPDIPKPEIPKTDISEDDFSSSKNFYESFSDDVDSVQEELKTPESEFIDVNDEESQFLEPDNLDKKEFSGLDEFKKTSEKDVFESEDVKTDMNLEDDLPIGPKDKIPDFDDLEQIQEPPKKELKDDDQFLRESKSTTRKKEKKEIYDNGLDTAIESVESTPEYEYAEDEKFNASFLTKFIVIIASFASLIALIYFVILPWVNDQLIDDPPPGQEVELSEVVPANEINEENQTSVDSQNELQNDANTEETEPEIVNNDNQIEEETRRIEEPAAPAVTTQDGLYRNIPNESPVRGLIFTDGSKYFFQVSSWRNTEKAESEVRRLRNLGYDAFIVEAYIPKFKSTWYRVKIGDFNSVTEAERFQRDNKF